MHANTLRDQQSIQFYTFGTYMTHWRRDWPLIKSTIANLKFFLTFKVYFLDIILEYHFYL